MPKFARLLLELLHWHSAARPTPAVLSDLTPEDWIAFTAEAIQYRFAFQVNEYLRADAARLSLVPGSCLKQLQDSIRSTCVFNLVQQARLKQMLLACQERDIAVMPVKGLWQVELVYRDLGARSSGDIDLLFRPRDMHAFTRLAKDHGYVIPRDVDDICRFAPATNEFALRDMSGNSWFDIHWSLTHPVVEAPVDQESFWRRSEEVLVAGVTCRSLRLEDHIIYVCFHAAMHHKFWAVGPRALLDVALLIARPPRPIDWDDLISRAHDLGWQRAVWLMFDLVREHLGVSPPEAVLQALAPWPDNQHQVRRIAIEVMFLAQHQDSLPRQLARLTRKQSICSRMSVLGRLFFPSRAELVNQFGAHSESLGLLYARRWGLMVRRSVPQFYRLALGRRAARAELGRSQCIEDWLQQPRPYRTENV